MSSDSFESKIKLTLDGDEFVSTTSNVVEGAKEAEKAVEDLGQATTQAGQQASAAASELAKISTEAEQQARSIQTLIDAMKGVSSLPDTMTHSATGDWGSQVKSTISLNEQKHKALLAQKQEEEKRSAEAATAIRQHAEEKAAAESRAASQALRAQMAARAEEERIAGEAAHNARVHAEEKAAAERKASSDAIKARMEEDAAAQRMYDESINSLSNTRYALYDVAATWKIVGTATQDALMAMVNTSAEFESAFTGVERTVDVPVQQMEKIRDDLLDLSAAIPESFVDLSEIATIGGQLDIHGNNIVSFTENVAKFTAMTDASLDNTAMSFGRIDQLANNGIGAFDNIASSVYDVGVQTVATESEILKMSQELAATASNAGFAANEVIGLAGALSSLAVQPERARGAIQKSFAKISMAVENGGAELTNFAKVSGKSADDFAEAWKKTPAEAFNSFLTGLSQIENLDTALADLGLNDLRVADMFKRLAGNMDVVNHAMEVSKNAWIDHTAFTEAYGLVADDLSSKLSMLGNDISQLLDSLSNNSALGDFVDLLRGVVRVVQEVTDGINNIPVVGKAFSTGIPAILGAVSAIALVQAGMLTMRAGLYAVITAQDHMNRSSDVGKLKLREMAMVMAGVATTEEILAAKTDRASASMSRLGNTAGGATTKLTLVGGAATRAGSSLVSMLGGPWGIALTAATIGIGALGSSIMETQRKAEEFSAAFSSISSAIAQDTQAYREHGEAMKTIEVTGEGVILAIDGVHTANGALVSKMEEVGNMFGFAEDKVKTYTLALDEATKQAIVGSLQAAEGLTEMFIEHKELLDSLGISAEGYAESLMNQDTPEYLSELTEAIANLKAENQELIASKDVYGEAMEKNIAKLEVLYDIQNLLVSVNEEVAESTVEAAINAAFASGVYGETAQSAYDSALGNEYLADSAFNLADTLWGSAMAMADFEGALFTMGQSLYDNGTAMDYNTENGRANMQAWNGVINQAVNAAGGDMNALAQMLANAIAMLDEAGVKITGDFLSLVQDAVNHAASAVGAVAPQVNTLTPTYRNNGIAAGYAARENRELAKSLGGGGGGGNGVAPSAKKAAKETKEATKEVRTLTDYVKDLSSVMSAAFDIRFGLEESVDGVADSLQKIKDMKADALQKVSDAMEKVGDQKQKIRDLRTELAQLTADLNTMRADKGTLEFQLGIASKYGDTLRENELMAQIGKLNTDIAAKQNDRKKTTKDLTTAEKDLVQANKDVSAAQKDAQRKLTGTSESTRDQRSAVRNLVKSYQDQITELANTNISKDKLKKKTDELKKKFESELTQLGYNKTEIGKYSKALDDAGVIISKMPKDITLKVKKSAAERALSEFKAKIPTSRSVSLKAKTGSASNTLSNWRKRNTGGKGISRPINVPIRANTSGIQTYLNGRNYTIGVKATILDVDWTKFNASSKSFYDGHRGITGSLKRYSGGPVGNYTGSGGKYAPAGTVHGGEYVVKKEYVDQSTGLPTTAALLAMLSGRPVGLPSSGSSSGTGFPGTMIVELSPTDRKLIQNSGSAIITLDGRVLAQSVNDQNNNLSKRGM